MSYAPTLTSTGTEDAPNVHIEFPSLNGSTAALTLYRLYDGVQTTVRSTIDKAAAGAYSTDDPEVPIGVPVTYKAQQFDSSGNDLGYTDADTITVAFDSPEDAWLSDPLDPTTGVRVTMTATAGTAPSRPFDGTKYRVGLRTFVLTSQMSLLEGLDMGFFTATAEERDAVQALVAATNGLILIRTPPPMNIPRLLYCWAKNPVPQEFDLVTVDDVEWSNVVEEVSAPTGAAVTSLIPWQIYIDAFPTWADMKVAYLTWQDARSNPPEGA